MQKFAAILLIGIGITKTIFPIPALAEQNARKQSGRLVVGKLNSNITDEQKKLFFRMLDKVMFFLRDDQPFVFDKSGLGVVGGIESWKDDSGKRYSYNSDSLPDANILFSTTSDPMNYDDDRLAVPAVPDSFYFQFFSSKYGLDRQTLEKNLALESYWVDEKGEKHEGNSLPSFPPALRLHVFRYRAKELATSRFSVDVELFYFEPKDGEEKWEQRLDAVRIERAYPYLTPEMRKQKREEQQQKKRDQTW